MKICLLLSAWASLAFARVTVPINDERVTVASDRDNQQDAVNFPLYLTQDESCPQNMRLYPWRGTESAWICDCELNFLYFPGNDSCHKAYTRGPCPEGHYVGLVAEEGVGGCFESPCPSEGLVPFNGGCHPLGTREGPCAPEGVLSIDEMSLQVVCREIFTDVNGLVYNIAVAYSKITKSPAGPSCPPGTKRAKHKACMIVWTEEWQNSL